MELVEAGGVAGNGGTNNGGNLNSHFDQSANGGDANGGDGGDANGGDGLATTNAAHAHNQAEVKSSKLAKTKRLKSRKGIRPFFLFLLEINNLCVQCFCFYKTKRLIRLYS